MDMRRRTMAAAVTGAVAAGAWASMWAGAAGAAQTQPAAQPAPVVTIEQGRIRGKIDNEAAAYLGIPFAAPPVGELRWKPPQPPRAWEGVRDCTEFGPACPQPAGVGLQRDVGKQSEDCLYLNVWTHAASGARKPVMVWIHGGGCTTGAGSLSVYNGAELARAGVVLVTINYRLNAFGYLAHPLLSKESPRGVSGNYGHLDQVAALQWVNKNIAAFGGDPGCVTIFGESAGSVSVCRLMISPLAAGLFHRAIAQSGGAHGRNRHLRQSLRGQESMERVGEALARQLGCDGAGDVPAALRAKSPAEILAAANPAQGLFGKGVRFGPVIDGWAIPDDPGELFDQGKFHRVPMMLGSNADEGTMFLQQLPIQRTIGYRLAVRALFADQADLLLRLFPAERDQDVPAAVNKLVTVSAFAWPARTIARSMAAHGGQAYLYQFTRVPATPTAGKLGCFHGLEIVYAFGNLRLNAAFDATDRKLSRAMMGLWTGFAATGKPAGDGVPAWPAYDAAGDPHMELGERCEVRSGLFKQACDALDARTASTQPSR